MVRKLALISALSLSVTACTTFRGPGSLNSNAGSETGSSPSVVLNGDRQDTRLDEIVTFDWPVDEARMTRGFLSTTSRKKRAHWGLDLANHRGTPILAAQTGHVVYTGNGFKGYGRLIVIEHGPEWATLYSHLDKILVKEGMEVKQGEKIALMGRSGRATGNHLHFEIRKHRQPVNPLAYLPLGGAQQRGYAQISSDRLNPAESPQKPAYPQ